MYFLGVSDADTGGALHSVQPPKLLSHVLSTLVLTPSSQEGCLQGGKPSFCQMSATEHQLKEPESELEPRPGCP